VANEEDGEELPTSTEGALVVVGVPSEPVSVAVDEVDGGELPTSEGVLVVVGVPSEPGFVTPELLPPEAKGVVTISVS